MKPKVYCFASAKGGSGKTIICASFAAFLAELGKKVLILDVDIATQGLTLLYISEVNSHKEDIVSSHDGQHPQGLFDSGGFSWERDIVHLPNNVAFVPATFSFSIKENPYVFLESTLKLLIKDAKKQFDYIFLDAQAGSDTFSQIAMNRDISDEVVIVSEYDPLSAAGIERLKAMFRDDLIYARTWILLNKMLPEFVSTFSEFLEVSKYLTPIPWDPDVVRAYTRRRLPLDLDYGNQFTLSIMQSLKNLLGPEMASKIEQWAEGRASSIREPIEEQYQDAEKELKGLLEQKVLIDKRGAIRKLARITPIVAVLMGILSSTLFIVTKNFERLSEYLGRINLGFVVMISILIGMSAVVLLYTTKLWDRSAEREVEEARFTRQISILEDKLKKLEVLRKADLETLVKEGTRQK